MHRSGRSQARPLRGPGRRPAILPRGRAWRWILIAVALFSVVDAAALWSERPSATERAWQRYWQARPTPAPLPLEAPLPVTEPRTLPPPPVVPEPAGLDRWLRKTLGDIWPPDLIANLVGAVEIDLKGLSPEARAGALLLGRVLSPDAGVTVVEEGERLRITLSGDSEDA